MGDSNLQSESMFLLLLVFRFYNIPISQIVRKYTSYCLVLHLKLSSKRPRPFFVSSDYRSLRRFCLPLNLVSCIHTCSYPQIVYRFTYLQCCYHLSFQTPCDRSFLILFSVPKIFRVKSFLKLEFCLFQLFQGIDDKTLRAK